MSLASGHISRQRPDPLQKRVPTNPRYANVESRIDSGQNVDSFYRRHAQGEAARFRREGGARFKRIRLATLAKWLEAAQIVLSQPDFLDTRESIYDLEDGLVTNQEALSVLTLDRPLSVAQTEASVCGDEPGVPPMFMGGEDLREGEGEGEREGEREGGGPGSASAPASALASASAPTRTREAVEGYPAAARPPGMNAEATARRQILEETEDHARARDTFRAKNEASSVPVSGFPQAPTGLSEVQRLTTRARHEKVLQRIHLIPGLRLEIFRPEGEGEAGGKGAGGPAGPGGASGPRAKPGRAGKPGAAPPARSPANPSARPPAKAPGAQAPAQTLSRDALRRLPGGDSGPGSGPGAAPPRPRPQRLQYLPVPCPRKQFVVLDMRPEAEEFRALHVWGSVHLPVASLHRATNRMPPALHYFLKFDESIAVVVGLTGPPLEAACGALVEYGLSERNVVILVQGLEELGREWPGLVVRGEPGGAPGV